MRDFEKAGHTVAETTEAPNQSPTQEVDVAFSNSKRSPAFQFYPEAFLSSSKVIRMSLEERGAYITLLSICWLDGSLPLDDTALARTLGITPRHFARLWPTNLRECFSEKHGRLVNARLERERKKQADYRARQAEHGAKGGRPSKKGLASETESQTEAEKRSLSLSLPVSLSPSLEERTHTQAGAPLHTTHKKHAACGRVCVPADLHNDFMRARNHDGADKELRQWYLAVDHEWAVGSKKDVSPGGNDYKFWRARFEEEWPAVAPTKPDPRLPKWAQQALAAKGPS